MLEIQAPPYSGISIYLSASALFPACPFEARLVHQGDGGSATRQCDQEKVHDRFYRE
jgi:hypothetical protein